MRANPYIADRGRAHRQRRVKIEKDVFGRPFCIFSVKVWKENGHINRK